MIPFTPPEFNSQAFNCPHCNAYANQSWDSIVRIFSGGGSIGISDLKLAECAHCNKYTLWHFTRMLYPEEAGIQPPNHDLHDEIKEDYLEAKDVLNKSSRGAAALLRLCVQKLCSQLGEKGKNINDDIANLVKKGLPTQIQQALDVVRVVGNNAVHPGQIDLKDDRETAVQLFALVNLIADVMITQPKHINELYQSLPQAARDAVKRRDNST